MTCRILHSADLHLDAPLRSLALADPDLRERVGAASRDALRRLVGHALEADVAAVLLAGDVFDRAEQSLDAAAFFAAQMARLGEKDVPVFMIRGNHDYANRASTALPLPKNVHLFGPEGGTGTLETASGEAVAVHGVSYERPGSPGSLLERYPAPVPGAINIGLLHTSLAGSGAHDPYAPCSVADLAAHGYDYWALGHIHARAVHREHPFVVMPGSPQGRHINEPGPRSATEIAIDGGRITGLREIPTSAVVFERLEVALPEEGQDELDRLCRRAVEARAEALGPGQALVARLRVTGPAALLESHRRHAEFWRGRAREAVEDLSSAWIEQLDFAAGARAADTGDPTGPVAEIAALMRGMLPEPAVRHALSGILDEALDHLPPAERRGLVPDEAAATALLDRLSEEAVEEMAAALAAREEAR